MRQRAMGQLLGNQPEAITWALVSLPSGRRLKEHGWKRVETVWNGGFYERAGGLQARCRGVELEQGVRWWHVILGRRSDPPIGWAEVTAAVQTFFPEHAMVLQVHLPDQDQDPDEARGMIVHLWWAVDGNSGVPPVETWENEASFDPPEQAPTWQD